MQADSQSLSLRTKYNYGRWLEPYFAGGALQTAWGQRRYSWRLLGDGDGLAPQAFDSLRLSDPAADGREATQK